MKPVRRWFIGILVIIVALSLVAFGQNKEQYQTGAVTDVKVHEPNSDKDTKSYDVSVKVGNQIYVLLYKPPAGSDVIVYKTGLETTVLIDGKNMKVNDLTGKTWTLPILSRRDVDKKEGK